MQGGRWSIIAVALFGVACGSGDAGGTSDGGGGSDANSTSNVTANEKTGNNKKDAGNGSADAGAGESGGAADGGVVTVDSGGVVTVDSGVVVDSGTNDAGTLKAVPYRGVNMAAADFGIDADGNGAVPGTFGVDYTYPDPNYVTGYTSQDYFAKKGMTIFRLPFRWERLQPTRNQAFNSAELTRLQTTVSDMTGKGVTVLLDPHNYARYGTAVIGTGVPYSDFADFWTRLATVFKGNPNVIFGLMNEPHDMTTENWVSAANAAITGIRSTGATNLILVPGNGWTGADSWTSNWYGTANSTAMLNITDSGNNYAFEVHQYLDTNSSGTSTTCVSTTIGSQRLSSFTAWLKQNNVRGFLGEFSGGANATCEAAIDDMLTYIETNASVWLGWTFWAAGPWWGSGYPSIEPVNGQDTPPMQTLMLHL